MASMALAFFSVVSLGTFAAILTTVYLRESILSDILADPRASIFWRCSLLPLHLSNAGWLFQSPDAAELGSFFRDHIAATLRTIAALSVVGLLVSLVLGGIVLLGGKELRPKANECAVAPDPVELVSRGDGQAIRLVAIQRGDKRGIGSGVWNRRESWVAAAAERTAGSSSLLLRSFTLGRRSDRFFQEFELFGEALGASNSLAAPTSPSRLWNPMSCSTSSGVAPVVTSFIVTPTSTRGSALSTTSAIPMGVSVSTTCTASTLSGITPSIAC